MNVLFITWDGPQVSYLESLFLPIFKHLAGFGYQFHVLQFSWGSDEVFNKRRLACVDAGIPYRSVKILRRPRALSILTAIMGQRAIRKAVKEFEIDVLMPRSTMPALSTLIALRKIPIPMVFDADGLALDERVDFAGQSSSSYLYRLLRDIESEAVRRASVVLTRSSAASNILFARAGAGTSMNKFHVVTNGRDEQAFSPIDNSACTLIRDKMGIPHDAFLLVYAGSMGPQYCLNEMLSLLRQVKSKIDNVYLLLLTASPDYVQSHLSEHKDLCDRVVVRSVPFNEVSTYLASANVGLALRTQSFSMAAVAPVKLGEYLLCGLPVIATAGIGDTNGLNTDVVHLLNEHDDSSLECAADWAVSKFLKLNPMLNELARSIGVERFSLSKAVEDYRNALESFDSR